MPSLSMIDSLISLGKYFWVKILGAVIALAGFEFFVVNHELNKILYGLYLIILVDSILGLYTAITFKKLASWRMGKPMARKVILYSVAVLATAILSNSTKYFDWFPVYLGVYFILSEVLSIFEKLALLGVPLPMGVVSRVNELFKDFGKGKKDALDIIMRKKQ